MPSSEQDDINKDTTDLSGFDLDTQGIDHSTRNGFIEAAAAAAALTAFNVALNSTLKSFENAMERESLAAQNMVERVNIFTEIGILNEEESAEALVAAQSWAFELIIKVKRTRPKLEKIHDKLNEFFETTTDNVESILREGLQQQRADAKTAKKAAEKQVNDIQSKLDSNRIQEELIKKDSELHPDRKAENDKRLKTLEEIDRKDINDIVHADKAVKEAEELEKAAQEAYDASKLKKAADVLDTILKHTVLDIKKQWDNIKTLSKRFKTAGDIMIKGYTRFFAKFAQGAELKSDIYLTHALGFADTAALNESKAFKKSLERALAIEDKEAMEKALTRFLTPSSRLIITSQAEFNAVMEEDRFFAFTKFFSYMGIAVKDVARVPLYAGLRALEATLGPEIASGLAVIFDSIIGISIEIIDFALGPVVLVIVLFGYTVIDLIKDGCTWKFVDDLLSHFYLSLETVGGAGAKLKEYKDNTTLVGKAKSHQLTLMEFDSTELAMVLDFWGNEYIKLSKAEGFNYPAYIPLVAFDGIQKVPGKYINLEHHPYDTDLEIAECNHLESLVDMHEQSGDDFKSKSLLESWLPRKPGHVRNLRYFPIYENTMQWPDVKKGIAVQQGGNFSKHDIDDTIVKCFMLWADAGTHGPVYNTSKNKNNQRAAIAANRADLSQWLDPQSDWPLAWNELKIWVRSLRGKKGIMLGDMIRLAPELWLKEWATDLNPKDRTFFPTVQHSGRWMTDIGYKELRMSTGRYTYRPRDRRFLQEAIDGKVLRIIGYVFPGSPWPGNAKEVYSFGGIGPDAGFYAIYRPSTPAERKFYAAILKNGVDWKNELDKKSQESADAWQHHITVKIWEDYVKSEKPTRTKWSYISRHRNYFIEQLQYVCNAMAGKQRTTEWLKFTKLKAGSHIPLQMNGVHRVTFMGMFAALAYPEKVSVDAKFLVDIKKKFKAILKNDLVTTYGQWKNWSWAKSIEDVIISKKTVHDYPIMFGDLAARCFVLKDPCVLVIAIKGSNDFSDWTLNLDFSTGHFVKVNHDKSKNTVDLESEPNDSKKKPTQLVNDPNMMTVHRGFLRAAKALAPGIKELMAKYFKDPAFDIQDIFITGHSLGGAIASLLPFMLPRLPMKHTAKVKLGSFKNPNVYMFGCPAVGDERYGKQFNTWAGESAQVWIDGDIIVSLPPFLLPDAKQSKTSFDTAIRSIETIGANGFGLAGLLWAIHEVVQKGNLPPQFDLSKLFNKMKNFDKSKLANLVSEVFKAANDHRALRAGSVFMRLDGLADYEFNETMYDTGNSDSLFHVIATNPHAQDFLAKNHKIENIVGLLKEVAGQHPELFDINSDKIPSWADGGDISPDDPDKDKKVTKELADELMDGTARIIGYGKSKHWHKPYTMVERSDVEMESSVWMSDKTQEIISGLSHQGSKKRHKIDRHDHTYRGSDYM